MTQTAQQNEVQLGRGIKVLEDRVLIRRDEALRMTPGGIALPDQVRDTPDEGEVVATGPGRLLPELCTTFTTAPVEGKVYDRVVVRRAPMSVKPGDKVYFARYGGASVKHDGEDLLVLRETDIIAVVERLESDPSVGEDDDLEPFDDDPSRSRGFLKEDTNLNDGPLFP